jgi:hypothetical protein
MRNKTKFIILFFISSLVLVHCLPYPTCPKDITCTTVSAEKPITIPFILPLTSQNTALIEEQKSAIQLAFHQSKLQPDIYQLEFLDNYDLQINNQKQINSLLENPTSPLIVSSISSISEINTIPNGAGFSEEQIGKTKNSLFTLPGINDYILQAINAITNFLDLSHGQTILLTSYFHQEKLKSSLFCSQPLIDCYPFDTLKFDQAIQEKVKTADVLILASNQQDLKEWLTQIPLISNQKMILLDTNFQKPFFISNNSETIYWLLPNLWFEEDHLLLQSINQEDWNSAYSYWTYSLTKQLFQVLETNISPPKSGFRLIFTSQLREAIPNKIKNPVVLFKLYQFDTSQFIIKNNEN